MNAANNMPGRTRMERNRNPLTGALRTARVSDLILSLRDALDDEGVQTEEVAEQVVTMLVQRDPKAAGTLADQLRPLFAGLVPVISDMKNQIEAAHVARDDLMDGVVTSRTYTELAPAVLAQLRADQKAIDDGGFAGQSASPEPPSLPLAVLGQGSSTVVIGGAL